ncbi:hypothetical protein R6Q59_025624 [Mikania micrantha]
MVALNKHDTENGTLNKPPMFTPEDYDTWKVRMEGFIRNRTSSFGSQFLKDLLSRLFLLLAQVELLCLKIRLSILMKTTKEWKWIRKHWHLKFSTQHHLNRSLFLVVFPPSPAPPAPPPPSTSTCLRLRRLLLRLSSPPLSPPPQRSDSISSVTRMSDDSCSGPLQSNEDQYLDIRSPFESSFQSSADTPTMENNPNVVIIDGEANEAAHDTTAGVDTSCKL